MRVKVSADEIIDTEKLSDQTLQGLMDDLQNRIDGIGAELDQARSSFRLGVEPTDPTWFGRAKFARTKLNQAKVKLAAELAGRKREKRIQANAQDQLPKHFVKVAQQRLSPQTFDALMAEALRRYADTQQGVEALASFVFEVGE